MLKNSIRNKQALNSSWWFIFFAVMSYLLSVNIANAATTTVSVATASDILVNLTTQIPQLTKLVTALAYVMGMVFIFRGILELKHLGESRTMMSGEKSIKTPMVYLFVGAMLLYLPTSLQVGMSTFWAEPNPYGYVQQSDQWTTVINASFKVVQLFGVIAFIRGLVTLSHTAGHGQPGTLAKAITYIIAGIFCINIYQFVQVIWVTLGIQIS